MTLVERKEITRAALALELLEGQLSRPWRTEPSPCPPSISRGRPT